MRRELKKIRQRKRQPSPREDYVVPLKVEDIEFWYNSPDVTAYLQIAARLLPDAPWQVVIHVQSIDDLTLTRRVDARDEAHAIELFDEHVGYVDNTLVELQPLSYAFLRDEGFKEE